MIVFNFLQFYRDEICINSSGLLLRSLMQFMQADARNLLNIKYIKNLRIFFLKLIILTNPPFLCSYDAVYSP